MSHKLYIQTFPDGSHTDSFIVVSEMTKRTIVLEVYQTLKEIRFNPDFVVGEVIDAVEFTKV